jgi:hypothetical protein
MIYARDRVGTVVIEQDILPVQIQKMLLMSSYQELHLYMIENKLSMVLDDSIVLFSERLLMRLMPKHIQKPVEDTSTCVAAKHAFCSRICIHV